MRWWISKWLLVSCGGGLCGVRVSGSGSLCCAFTLFYFLVPSFLLRDLATGLFDHSFWRFLLTVFSFLPLIFLLHLTLSSSFILPVLVFRFLFSSSVTTIFSFFFYDYYFSPLSSFLLPLLHCFHCPPVAIPSAIYLSHQMYHPPILLPSSLHTSFPPFLHLFSSAGERGERKITPPLTLTRIRGSV